jgi:hypothetical protein
MRQINETDWKLLQRLKGPAIERLCRRHISRVKEICRPDDSPYKRFLEVFSEVNKGNDAISRSFDDLRRSTAIVRLAAMRKERLIADEEFSNFGDETRNFVNALNGT